MPGIVELAMRCASRKTDAVRARAGAVLVHAAAPARHPQDKAAGHVEPVRRDTDETVLDDMIQTQDRARAVEDLTTRPQGRDGRGHRAVRGRRPSDER
ncbi:MAG: hypothetical protein MZW92_07825 [Comamonadaceae bacterium]|nr:hypothetical protein [Comamonadaceae bacterium]